MRLSKRFSAIGFTVLLTACATPADQREGTPAAAARASEARADRTMKTLKTGMVDANRELVEAPDNDWDLHVTLRAIPGAFGGAPVASHAMLIPIRLGESFDLSMSDLEKSIAPLAQRASAETTASGIDIQPADTRIARVATFFYDRQSGKDVMGAGFRDPARREHLTLSYFDRPCTVSGTVQDGDGTISISLDIPEAGLYWIRSDDTEPAHSRMMAAEPGGVLWYVTPQPGGA